MDASLRLGPSPRSIAPVEDKLEEPLADLAFPEADRPSNRHTHRMARTIETRRLRDGVDCRLSGGVRAMRATSLFCRLLFSVVSELTSTGERGLTMTPSRSASSGTPSSALLRVDRVASRSSPTRNGAPSRTPRRSGRHPGGLGQPWRSRRRCGRGRVARSESWSVGASPPGRPCPSVAG